MHSKKTLLFLSLNQLTMPLMLTCGKNNCFDNSYTPLESSLAAANWFTEQSRNNKCFLPNEKCSALRLCECTSLLL